MDYFNAKVRNTIADGSTAAFGLRMRNERGDPLQE